MKTGSSSSVWWWWRCCCGAKSLLLNALEADKEGDRFDAGTEGTWATRMEYGTACPHSECHIMKYRRGLADGRRGGRRL